MTMTEELPREDVIELEPTVEMKLLDPTGGWTAGSDTSRPGVAMVAGSLASLAGEIGSLRRRRIGAAALFLAVGSSILFLWSFIGFDLGNVAGFTHILGAIRIVLAATVACLLLSRLTLSAVQIQVAEYALFGGFICLMAINQYYVDLDLLRHDDIPGEIAFIKNGVLGTIVLMVLYGMLVPNHPLMTAKVVCTMALIEVAVLTFVMEQPDVARAVEQFRTTERTGTNVLFLALGAGLAIYGSYLLNGLRIELHQARKFGQYQLVQKLGEGGMGEVYLAQHQLLKRPCALKLIKPEAGTDPVAAARFEREVQSAARLSHPNTIEIYDYGHTDDGTFYYVMEFLQGLSLQDLVRSAGPLPAGRVIFLFRQVCAGLAEAHTLGLVHRDLKPANMFVAVRGGETDVTKVLDFGLVKLTQDTASPALTGDMMVSGTPLYMAPEQATADRALDSRADIYALGAMMYFALTGQPPFQGETPFAVMIAHSRDPVVPPSKIKADIPEDLEQVVLRCLAKKPDERYQDVKALAQALAACKAAGEWDADRADRWWADHG
jgi:eukaryotic-like serine/threonine-protein kinase